MRGGATATSPAFPTVTNRRREKRRSVEHTSFSLMETMSRPTTNIDGFLSEDLEPGQGDRQDTLKGVCPCPSRHALRDKEGNVQDMSLPVPPSRREARLIENQLFRR